MVVYAQDVFKEIPLMYTRSLVFLVVIVSLLVLLAACGGSQTPTPVPTPTSAVNNIGSVTPTTSRPTRIPPQTSEQQIRGWALDAYTNSCDRNYREDVTEFDITNIGQGNVTQRMQTDQNIEEIWCVNIVGKCGNVDFTKNLGYIKVSGEWRAEFHDPDWSGTWEKMGCPFSMIR